jgi:putative ABC transport system permease protein
MLGNNLKLAWRRLAKNRTVAMINLLGLAFGLAAAIAVLLYVEDELSYEAFHEKAERIVRVNIAGSFDGQAFKFGAAPNAMAPFIERQIAEVEKTARVFPHNFGETAFIRVGEDNFTEPHLYWADPSLFEVFTLRMRSGDPGTALSRVNTAILSASTARRFFGDADPVGKTIKVDNVHDLEITGVFDDFPSNTHYLLKIVGSFQTIGFGKPEQESWGNASFPTFLVLQSGTDAATLQGKINEILKKELPEDRQWFSVELKALRDIHLYSEDITHGDKAAAGDRNQIRILTGLAVLLLLIACINYMNLATARSQQRAKEVGVSKTLGASTGRLALQFYTETALLTLAGIILSIGLLSAILPFFNTLTDKQLTLSFLGRPVFWLSIGTIWIVVTGLAGAYPAAFLSSFLPVQALRKDFRAISGAGLFRKGLVVFQFCVSTGLIISTLVFYQQLNFIRNKKLGYNPEQVVAVRISGIKNRAQIESLEKEIRQLAAVAETSLSQTFPGEGGSGRNLQRPEASAEGAPLTTCRAHPEVFEALDIPLLAGKPMRMKTEGDTITEVVLNRSAVEYLGWTPEEAIGQRIEASLGYSIISGVMEDFHFGSLHQPVGYFAFHNAPYEWLQYLLVRLETERLFDSMQQLQKTFARVAPESAFDYVFLDDHLDTLYRAERRLAKVVLIFAGLAVFVACLGLFALAAFTAEQRTKEIGIRKILGASVQNLVGLMSKEFIILVLISIVLAVPLAWYGMSRWLENFAYRIDLQWWVFMLAAILAVAIAFLTVSATSVKAALANPVEALRND